MEGDEWMIAVKLSDFAKNKGSISCKIIMAKLQQGLI